MAQRQAADHTFTLALTLTLDVKHTGRHTRHDELGALRLGPRYQSTDPIAHIPSDLPLARNHNANQTSEIRAPPPPERNPDLTLTLTPTRTLATGQRDQGASFNKWGARHPLLRGEA